jgi:glucose-1-phosphate adenylyltransferase
VGTIDAYHEAHMDLVSVDPVFNLYNEDWPIWTYPVQMPGAKFVLHGTATDSIVSPGCIISGGSIDDSVLSPNVRVMSKAVVEDSVLLSNVRVGEKATIRRAILDKNVVVPDGGEVGVDHEADLARGFTVSEGGITVVGKGVTVRPPT